MRAYANAKRAQVELAAALAAREGSGRVAFHAMHPGWVDTPGLRESLPRFARLLGPILRTPRQGADTMAWLALDAGAGVDSATSGSFWLDRRQRVTTVLPWTRTVATERDRLVRLCEASLVAPREPTP